MGVFRKLLKSAPILILLLSFLLLPVQNSFAFLFDVEILDQESLEKLSDEELIELYIDVIVELEAVKAFYETSGITPKEINKYKKLIRFRITVLFEIDKRELKIPRTSEKQ